MARRVAATACLAAVLGCTVAATGIDEPPHWDAPTMAQALPGVPGWSTCQVAVVMPRQAPADLPGLMRRAADDVSTVAGVDYIVIGDRAASTAVSAVTVRLTHRPSSWLQIPGSAAETSFNGSGEPVAVTIDLDWWADLPADGPGSRYQLLLHELLHTAGVSHAHDHHSTMAPDLGTATGITPDAAHIAHLRAPTNCTQRWS